jgi:hypothetical protein
MTMFRFTIRDVLWLTVVVAMAAGWYCDRTRQAAAFLMHARTQGELIRSANAEAERARASESAARKALLSARSN